MVKRIILICFLIFAIYIVHTSAEEITFYDPWEGTHFSVKEPLSDLKKPEKEDSTCKASSQNLNILVPEITQKGPIPLRTQDKIIRVLVFPYKISKSQLMGQQYVYLKVSEGDWVLGTYLLEKPEAGTVNKTFKPLTRKDTVNKETIDKKKEDSDKKQKEVENN